jgi:hypothetical protein
MVDTGLNGHLINHRFKDIVEAIGKRPFAVRLAHGPEWPVVKANSHNRQSKGCVTLIPRDFVPQWLRDGHFPSAYQKPVFRQSCLVE